MRVNPNQVPDLLAAIAAVSQQQNDALTELATGRRVNSPSDDPAAAATVVQLHDRQAQDTSYLRTMSNLSGQLQTADGALSSVVTSLTRAITLGTQGATGTMSQANQNAVALEVAGIRDELVNVANLNYQGTYLFAGTAQNTPYVFDGTMPSGIRYAGDAGVNAVSIGTGYEIPVDMPGADLFSGNGSDAFLALQHLITSLHNNAGIPDAVQEVKASFEHITSQRVFYGNTLNQITNQQTYLQSEKLQLSDEETTVAGADIAEVSSRLAQSSNARNATLAGIGRSLQATLFDYLS